MDQKKLALIHIIKKELGLSDEEYRGILREAAGVETAKDLDGQKFRKLMNFFVRSRHYQVNPHGLTLRQKMFINNLVHDLRWEDDHLKNFLEKYYHKGEVDHLTKQEAMKVIESLKNIKSHQTRGDPDSHHQESTH